MMKWKIWIWMRTVMKNAMFEMEEAKQDCIKRNVTFYNQCNNFAVFDNLNRIL